MSVPINIASSVEIVRDGDLLATSLALRHGSSAAPCTPAISSLIVSPVRV
jgi:hypothetical protein